MSLRDVQRTARARRMATCVEVANISAMLEENHIKELFEVVGVIKSLNMKVVNGAKICNIEFEEPSHAQAAAMLDGTPLGDRPLQVAIKQAAPKPAAPAPAANGGAGVNPVAAASLLPMTNPLNPLFSQALLNNPGLVALQGLSASMVGTAPPLATAGAAWTSRTVYVGNLAGDVTEQQLRTFFQTQDMAEKALMLTGGMIGGRQIKVGKANDPIGKPSQPHPNKLKAALAALQRVSDKGPPTSLTPLKEPLPLPFLNHEKLFSRKFETSIYINNLLNFEIWRGDVSHFGV
eukprot:g63790.t1